jgi:hypothetical protein
MASNSNFNKQTWKNQFPAQQLFQEARAARAVVDNGRITYFSPMQSHAEYGLSTNPQSWRMSARAAGD